MDAINPATGDVIATYPPDDAVAVSRALNAAVEAQAGWRYVAIGDRAEALTRLGVALRAQRSALAALMTDEMGKPIAAAEAEVDKCASACDHFADCGPGYLAPQVIATDARHSYVRHDPLGVVLAIMPWNFPLWQVVRCLAPALVAGNAVVLKHASNVPGCSRALQRTTTEAHLPPGLFASLLISAAEAERLVADPRIAAVSLTGSEAAGLRVAAAAGAALKKCVLELGGSDAFIVLADADVPSVAARAAEARVINNGESCIAAKRFIVETAVAEPFERAFVDAMRALRVGDPRDRATQVGPLARADLLDELERQVEASVSAGARLALGGRRAGGRGFFFPPTVLLDVAPGMPAFDEETFGPVGAVVRARDEAHAIELANRSRYGLGASVWTADVARGERIAAEIEAGSVFVNGIVRSDPRLPFGGVKRSGYGRELSEAGSREFVNLKTVWVEAASISAATKHAASSRTE
jgi:succinate-semialdehyde dehydrogenase